MKVLITWYTKTGSTQEAAEIIGAELTARGFQCELRPMSQIGSIAGYDAIVAGAPVNGMQWAAEATAFIERFRPEFAGKRVALFSLAYVYFTGRASWKDTIDQALTRGQNGLNPVHTGVFPGRVAKRLPWIARALFGIPKAAESDLFDRARIIAWADTLAGLLK